MHFGLALDAAAARPRSTSSRDDAPRNGASCAARWMHRSRRMRMLAALATIGLLADVASAERVLRVCADPNNAPLSTKDGPSFEGAIAKVLATAMDARLEYTWSAQRRGFYRNTLNANECDVIIGVPADTDAVRTTTPYYRSSYAFVTRARDKLAIASLDDARLRALRIGVMLVGDEGANPPPVHALARRGIIDNVVGYNVVGDYATRSPPADALRALERREVDVAIVWGPIAGGFARTSRTKLAIQIIPEDRPALPMTFAISLGVRKADKELAAELERILAEKRVDIAKVLSAWRIPLVPDEAPQ
jgi:mxaJ protein